MAYPDRRILFSTKANELSTYEKVWRIPGCKFLIKKNKTKQNKKPANPKKATYYRVPAI